MLVFPIDSALITYFICWDFAQADEKKLYSRLGMPLSQSWPLAVRRLKRKESMRVCNHVYIETSQGRKKAWKDDEWMDRQGGQGWKRIVNKNVDRGFFLEKTQERPCREIP
ncbi:hypothetical protein F5Y09DRAFT_221828 [Xylaria sp. FL1042]|nr:hypothetical protein F5Y09DRAFT_221828 [Xylaria sp. FL1042]